MWSILMLIGILLATINSKFSDELAQKIEKANPDEMISCIVIMKESYPYQMMEEKSIHERIVTYQQIAQKSQQPVIDWLKTIPGDAQIHHRYWVLNGFHLEAKSWVLKKLAARDDVGWISHNGEVHIIAEPSFEPAVSSRTIEWNIQKVMADSCWNAGFTGQGVIIGMCDTGVDYQHPALAGKWTGYWLDVINGQSTPYDDMNGTWHGTHCMGTILGGDGFGSFQYDIGVAPDAKYVAAKMLNSSGSGTYDQCLQGLQFMADLKDSVDIKAVSNSWGGSNGADTFFYPIMRTYISIGIVPVFANGNNGPNPNTVGCPGSYSNNIGVGATDSNDDIANFSSRGPAPDQVPFNDPSTWLRNDWNLTKPQISAPGVNINSAKGDGSGGYHTLNGTSMATPHVAGAIAILCQKNPTLTPQMIYSILLDNVDQPSQGAPYPNNTYGWGRLNVWKALQSTPTVNQPWISLLQRDITDPPPGGNGNGLLEPGETGEMVVTIKNIGGADAYNTTGTLESYDNYVTIQNETYFFGDLAPDQTASNSGSPFLLLIHDLTPQGHTARIGLVLHADGENDTLDFDDTLYYTITIGTAPAPTAIYEDDFEYGGGIDSFPNYWDATGNWARSTQDAHSPTHSAYSGSPLDNATTLTLKNGVDLTPFSDPQFGLWHRYDFDLGIFMDDCAVQISTDGGSSWSDVWTYNWMDGNTLDWTEQTFSLRNYISNNVKVRFLIDANTFFQDYTDWFIDDIKLFTPTDNEPPYFTNTTVWPDTNYTGPFPVQSKITDESGVDQAKLYYRVNNGSWQELVMSAQGNDIYSATIPAQSLGDKIDYYLWAQDNWITPNEGCDPIGAPGYGYYSFNLIVGISEDRTKGIQFMPLVSNPTRGPVDVRFSIPKKIQVNLAVYDVTGRRVAKLIDKRLNPGEYHIQWTQIDEQQRKCPSGIYFLKFTAESYSRIEKLILVK